MNASLLAVLTDAERLMVGETEPARLAALDEDAAIALEARIRRARDKYTGQYRRAASVRVPEQGGRGVARPMNTRAALKAEAFEGALARVSRRVAALARQSAARLRDERLAAARAAKLGQRPGSRPANARPGRTGHPGRAARPGGDATATTRAAGRQALRTPASEKRRASTQATGDRRQARRDSKRAAARGTRP